VPALVPVLFRAMTDSSFSNDERRNALALLVEERPAVGWTEARFFLGDYSYVANDIKSGLWWYRHAHGFPPQCRPVGADDFECE
jgi:hypothetical protein